MIFKTEVLFGVLFIFILTIFILLLEVMHLKHSRDYYKEQVSILNDKLEDQNESINHWQQALVAANEKIKKEEERDISDFNKKKNDNLNILNEKVSDDCHEAMEWGIKQAQGFRNGK